MRFGLTVVYLAAATASVLAASLLLRRRQLSAGVWLALMILAAGFWALCDAVELQATTPSGKMLVSQLQYLGVVSAAPFFLHAAIALARRASRPGAGVLLAVWLIPAVTLVLAWTSGWHQALWRGITIPDRATNAGVYEYGWWFWVFAGHSYVLLAVGAVALVAATRRVAQPLRAPLSAVLLAVVLPWLGNIAYIAKVGPVPGLNWLSISILLSGFLLAWAARRGVVDLLPHARETVVDSMRDGVIVVDGADRIIFANAAAHELLWQDTVPAGLPHELQQASDAAAATSWQAEVELARAHAPLWLDVRTDPVHDRWSEVAGRVVVVRDITQRKALEAERERLIAELEEALGRVRTLEGMLPQCAGCHRIRDTDDSWSELSEYLRRRTRVSFSHGFCPDCVQRLYGDVVE